MTAPSDRAPRRVAAHAARVRFVLARLLGPWGWALAALGVLLAAVPGGVYSRPPAEFWEGRDVFSEDVGAYFDALEEVDAVRAAAPPRVRAWVGTAGNLSLGYFAAWHPRALCVRVSGPAFVSAVVPPEERPVSSDPFAPHPGYAAELKTWHAAAAGLAWRRAFGGPDVYGGVPEAGFSARAWRIEDITVSLRWLAVWPLAWTAARVGSAWRDGWGDPRPAGLARRLARPWAWTAAGLGAGLAVLGGGDFERGPELGAATATLAVRRDPFTPLHPRFLRLWVDAPQPPPAADGTRPEWTRGGRAWGIRLAREQGFPTQSHYAPTGDADAPRQQRELYALDLSLWYVLLLPAAWSAFVPWSARRRRDGNRRRPAVEAGRPAA